MMLLSEMELVFLSLKAAFTQFSPERETQTEASPRYLGVWLHTDLDTQTSNTSHL